MLFAAVTEAGYGGKALLITHLLGLVDGESAAKSCDKLCVYSV